MDLDPINLSNRNIAEAAVEAGYASRYEVDEYENVCRLFHRSNDDLSLVFSLETEWENDNEREKFVGWTYTKYETDQHGVYRDIGTDGYGIDTGMQDLVDNIVDSIRHWALD